MIDLRFCGRLGDLFGAALQIELPDDVRTVAALRDHLDTSHQTDLLAERSVRAVVNDAVVSDAQAITDGDRIDFLPPVGGG